MSVVRRPKVQLSLERVAIVCLFSGKDSIGFRSIY